MKKTATRARTVATTPQKTAKPVAPVHEITLLVRGSSSAQVGKALRARLKRQLRRALTATGTGAAAVCLSLTDDAELLALNQQYADEDHATDVLSFSQREQAPVTDIAEHAPPGLLSPALLSSASCEELGDIVISIDTATRQAAAQRHSLDYELLHLSVHGLCHLLGYDHATAEDERRMFGYEEKLRNEALAPGRVRIVSAPEQIPPSLGIETGMGAARAPIRR